MFQRPATNAAKVHQPWLANLVEDAEVGTFAGMEAADGSVDGFVIITTLSAPPVYDPGVCPRSSTTSRSAHLTVGRPPGLPFSTQRQAGRACGAVRVVVVRGPHDQPKRDLLKAAGLFFVASEWFTVPLA
ncbi:hypothetical protein [Nocardioides sp.]|uniref:hypothetical protein n=1 Tax=Nocardioides sp. TaxID=35761 RepID=UPI003528198D